MKATDVLTAAWIAGPNHRVDETVHNDGFINTYTIHSRFGAIKAVSTAALGIRINEIDALAEMEKVQSSSEFADAALEAGEKAAEGAVKLVSDPVGTVSGAVSGVGRLFKRAGESLKSGPNEEMVSDVSGFSKSKREVAFEFRVDPYSSNQILQARLEEIAWAGYVGGFIIGSSFGLVSGGVGTFMSVSQGNRLMNEQLATTAPSDLRKLNRELLLAMGVDDSVAELFVNNQLLPNPADLAGTCVAVGAGSSGVLRQTMCPQARQSPHLLLHLPRWPLRLHRAPHHQPRL